MSCLSLHNHQASPSDLRNPSGPLELGSSESFLRDVCQGLQQSPKSIPSKYLYDRRGSKLFDEICELDEYYVTRTETSIMQRYASQMGEHVGEAARLVEFGSGSSIKTRLLLDHLRHPVAYLPVDISTEHLLNTARSLQRDYPNIEVIPIAADFTQSMSLPDTSRQPQRTTIYFPGSTIGNFPTDQAQSLLSRIAQICKPDDGLLIGVDLQKDVDTLQRAYDDSAGVTAQFNLNLLHRLRNELGASVDPENFEHHAIYNSQKGRIESYLRSLKQQSFSIGDHHVALSQSELIHTEYSYKYTLSGFQTLAAMAGFGLQRCWTDPRNYFAVMYLNLR